MRDERAAAEVQAKVQAKARAEAAAEEAAAEQAAAAAAAAAVAAEGSGWAHSAATPGLTSRRSVGRQRAPRSSRRSAIAPPASPREQSADDLDRSGSRPDLALAAAAAAELAAADRAAAAAADAALGEAKATLDAASARRVWQNMDMDRLLKWRPPAAAPPAAAP